jgi:potassium-dependent mechanosensitive channel
MRRILAAFLLFLATGLFGPPAIVQAQESPAEKLQRWEANLAEIEKTLADNPDLPPERYGRILRAIAVLVSDARALRGAEQQVAQPIRSQLSSLGAPPAEGQPPEDLDVVATRTRLSEELSRSQGRITRAELAITRAQAIENEIGRREQAMAQAKLAARGPSPLLPATWHSALSEDDLIYKQFRPSAMEWWRKLQIAEMSTVTIAAALFILLVAGILAFPLRRWVLMRWGPAPVEEPPSYGRRIVAAAAEAVGRVLLPALAVLTLRALFKVTSPLNESEALPIFVTHGARILIFYFIVSGLTISCLSPKMPAWRLVPVSAEAAVKLGRRVILGVTGLSILSFMMIGATNPETMQRSEAFDSILALAASVIASVAFLPCLHAKYWLSETHFKSRLSWVVRTIAALTIVASLAASVLGYASLSRDLLSSLLISAILIGAALLLREIIGEGIRAFMTPGRRLYDVVSRSTGLSPEGGRRTGFWIRLAADLILWPPVIYAVLIACGLSPTLLNAWTVRFFTQIRLGDLNFSLVDTAAAILTVVVGFLLVGVVKRWVRERVMPNTQLDLGMQNSIATGLGYCGGLIVLMLGIMVLGIDFSNIALVAGALSVGIGFGLRTVVENFVAGLLLLIERPIKTGDWIMVGTTEGIVKSISVRSTEIETFDRSSVIVPNSVLIASPVTNWTHKNRIARLVVKLSVALGADARLIERLLLEAATRAEHVMKHPAPSVVLRAITQDKMDFELRCFISDTDYYLPTLSAVNFATDEALRRAKVEVVASKEPAAEPPPPAPPEPPRSADLT